MFKINLCKYNINPADCQGVNNINLKVNIKKLTVNLINFLINIRKLSVNINQFLNKLINNCFLYAVFFSSLVIARVFANSFLISVNLLTDSHISFYWFCWFFLLVFLVFLSYPREKVLFLTWAI